MPTRGHRTTLHAKASFIPVEINRKCKTWSCSSWNWKEHWRCFWFPKIKRTKWCSGFPIHMVWEVKPVSFLKWESSKSFSRWTSVEQVLKVFCRAWSWETFMTFATLTSVVRFLLVGRSGSLPRCARILSGLKENFLQGVGKLRRKNKRRQGYFGVETRKRLEFTQE